MLKKIQGFRPLVAFLALSVAVLSTGCATTVPQAQFSHSIAAGMQVGTADKTSIAVSADASLNLRDYDRERIQKKIESALAARKAANPGVADREVLIDVKVTRYEKGNAFARAMLAGLGQIHIEGKVDVYTLPDKQLIGSFMLDKTFAWGGIYGASTSIEDIEQTFAEGVAAAVTGGAVVKK